MVKVFEATTDIVLILKVENNQVRVMPTNFTLASNQAVTEIIYLTAKQFLQGVQAQEILDRIQQVSQTQWPQSCEYSIYKDNSILWFHANVSPLSENSVLWVARDITQQKRTEQYLTIQHATALALAESANLSEAIVKILQTICDRLDWQWGELWQVDNAAITPVLRCVEIWHPSTVEFAQFEASTQQATFLPGVGLPGQVWQRGDSVWIEDVVQDDNFLRRSAAAKVGLHGSLAFPIRLKEQVSGVFVFFSRVPRQPDYDLLQLFNDLGSQIGQSIERQQVEDKLEASEAELRALFAGMTDVIFVLDAQGRYLKVAPTNPALLYKPTDELIGKRIHEVLPQAEADSFLELIGQVIATKVVVNIEYSLTIENREMWFFASISLLSENSVLWVARDITERKQAEINLRESEERYRFLYHNTPVMLHSIDSEGKLISVSDYWLQKLGYDKSEVIGRPSTDFLTEASRHYATTISLPEFFATGTCHELPYQFVKKNGEIMNVLLSAIAERNEAGEITRTLAVLIDVSDRLLIEKKLFAEQELAQVTLHSIGDAVITTDQHSHVQYLNPVAEQLTGWQEGDAKGKPLQEIFCIVNETTRQPVESPVEKALREGRIVGLANHTMLIARDGTQRAIDDSAAPIRNKDGQIIGAVLVFHDVTEARNLSHQLSWQASHDELTGLVNRREFEQRLTTAIALVQNSPDHHALCYLDLDQFKVVNDTCGHSAGDELLRQITDLLKGRIRATDTLARLGGDEFGLLLLNCHLSQAEQVADILRQLVEDFRFTSCDKSFKVGVSIGVVAINAESKDLSSVLSAADSACYAAKEKGRNCVHVYRTNDSEMARQRGERQWIAKINQALAEDRFCLYYQKIIPVTEGVGETHHEILIRLIDEKGQIVLPGAFIPAAERYNLMPAIDRWVIRTFCSKYRNYCSLRTQQQPSLCGYIYTINLSGASLSNDQFLGFLKQQLIEHQVPPQIICFEITETAVITNLSQAKQLITELKQLGCHFALDDFGNGMSSLNYLKHLPVDYLKIDGSFIKNIVSDRVDRVMTEGFNQIAHAMGMETIAEFVENEEIFNQIREIGIDYAQGYGIAKPCPLYRELTPTIQLDGKSA